MVNIPPIRNTPSTASSDDPNAQILASIQQDLITLQSLACANPPGDPNSSPAAADLMANILKLKSYGAQDSPYVYQMTALWQQLSDISTPPEQTLALLATIAGTADVFSQVANGQTPSGSAPLQKAILEHIGTDLQMLANSGSYLIRGPILQLALTQAGEIGNGSVDLYQSIYNLEDPNNFNIGNVDNFIEQVNQIQ